MKLKISDNGGKTFSKSLEIEGEKPKGSNFQFKGKEGGKAILETVAGERFAAKYGTWMKEGFFYQIESK